MHFSGRSDARGQASVELLAALPVALFVLLASWQLVLAGRAWWAVSESSRLAARAVYVASRSGSAGISKAGDDAAVKSLPPALAKTRRLKVGSDGQISLSARVPLAAPLAAAIGRSRGPRIAAKSRFGE
jgi:hypothetical protein